MITVENLSARQPPLALARISFSLEAGMHVLLGAPAEGGPLLLAVLAGRARARGGSARVLERRAGDPSTARAIAYVPLAPPLPEVLTVGETLRAAATIRGESAAPAEERLAALGVESLAARLVKTLAPEEARAVALAEALTSSVATVLLLDEPFVGVDPRAMAAIGERLRERAKGGACILVATASPSDAAIARSVLLFARGALVRHEASARAVALLTGRPSALRIVASDPRALVAELAREQAATNLDCRDGALFVRGDDPIELGAAIQRAVLRAGVDLIEMRADLPAVEELQAAATGAAAAAYQSAFARARATIASASARGSGAA